MRALHQTLLILATLALAACGTTGRPPPPTGAAGAPGQKVGNPYQVAGVWYYPQVDHEYDETGTASWYGREFHGRPTANGERFDMNKVTAAHPTLPLPSTVRVTNLENGRVLSVRINDRGPFARGRIIDLSRRSAQLLGFEHKGTARVRVQIMRPDGSVASRGDVRADPRELAAGEQVVGPLYVQVGAFADFENARGLRSRLAELGEASVDPAQMPGGTVYRVRFGPFEDARMAQELQERLLRAGFAGARIFTDRIS